MNRYALAALLALVAPVCADHGAAHPETAAATDSVDAPEAMHHGAGHIHAASHRIVGTEIVSGLEIEIIQVGEFAIGEKATFEFHVAAEDGGEMPIADINVWIGDVAGSGSVEPVCVRSTFRPAAGHVHLDVPARIDGMPWMHVEVLLLDGSTAVVRVPLT